MNILIRTSLRLVLIASLITPAFAQQPVVVPASGIPNGAIIPFGNTTDAKCAATDSTAEALICLVKEISFVLQSIPADAADGATPTSNPVPVACIEAPSSTLTTGQQGYLWCGPNHALYANSQPTAATSGGAGGGSWLSDGSTTAVNIKSSAGQLYGIVVTNVLSSPLYIRTYNASSAPTCTSATGIVDRYIVPAATTGAGFALAIPIGEAYSTGIGFCATTTISDTNNTAVASASVAVTYQFK